MDEYEIIFILCIILPPIATAISGGFSSFLINIILTYCGWLPGVVHTFMVTKNARVEEEKEQLMATIKKIENTDTVKQKSIFNSLLAGLIVGGIILLILFRE
ncbi:MAG: YqaE/Pmp3 family membrane protein [Proteobacteria bacterium]|nr:YqaE/Pmp3 family membrane protein [Pseudomonadota bacterium]